MTTWKSAHDLMEATFTIDDELRWLCDLVDAGHCSPLCLFGMEDGPCQCRCEGVHHAAARPKHGESDPGPC